jgi:mRNA interferase MazF
MTVTTPSKLVIKRGDVALALFPNSDLRTAKSRPVLIVQADGLGTGLAQLVTAMITSNMARSGHPSRVSVSLATPEGQQSGLLTESVVMTDNLATVIESAVSRVVGSLPMAEVEIALRHTLGL